MSSARLETPPASSSAVAPPPPGKSRDLRRVAASYAHPDRRRALLQLGASAAPFFAIMVAVLWALDRGVWPALLLVVPAAALLVRLFMIQHDCGHGSFFGSRAANDALGRVLGVFTLTPYGYWRKCHAVHHASVGNLDRRGTGDITTLTVAEYRGRPAWRRLVYRLYRHPLVMFGIGPAYLFLFRHRVPIVNPRREFGHWISILANNLAIVVASGLAIWAVGLGTFLLGYLPMLLIAASAGVWLFYVQHQFEGTYWADQKIWDFHAAALQGSSYYDLPDVLHWATANIGFHHLHHLCSKIPSYRLRECFDQNLELRRAQRLTLLASLRSARLALWDEVERKLVTFAEARMGPRGRFSEA